MKFLTIYATLVILAPNDATQHYSSKLGADRNQNKENLDMDSLMDTHCPQCQMKELAKEPCAELSPMKSKPQHKPKVLSKYFESVLLPESGTGDRIFGSLKAPQETSSTENAETEFSSSEANTIPPVLRKLFLDHGNKVSKRGSISNTSVLHRWRKARKTREKPSSGWADLLISPSLANNVLAPKIIPPFLQSLKGSTVGLLMPPCKRCAGTINASKEQPKVEEKQGLDLRKTRDLQDQEKWNWEEWHSIQKPNTVRKREAGRRLKISDIWNKPKKDHDEPVKIVLPLLLPDMKESRDLTKPIMLFLPKGAGKIAVHNFTSGTTTSAESLETRNFKVKGENGKEFSFSASISDVKQLLGLLAKPDSTLMLEKISPDEGKAEKNQTPSSTKKSTALVTPKPVDKNWLAGCSENSDTPELREIETDCLENVVQVDFPCNKSTAASLFSDSVRFSSTTEDPFDSK